MYRGVYGYIGVYRGVRVYRGGCRVCIQKTEDSAQCTLTPSKLNGQAVATSPTGVRPQVGALLVCAQLEEGPDYRGTTVIRG